MFLILLQPNPLSLCSMPILTNIYTWMPYCHQACQHYAVQGIGQWRRGTHTHQSSTQPTCAGLSARLNAFMDLGLPHENPYLLRRWFRLYSALPILRPCNKILKSSCESHIFQKYQPTDNIKCSIFRLVYLMFSFL